MKEENNIIKDEPQLNKKRKILSAKQINIVNPHSKDKNKPQSGKRASLTAKYFDLKNKKILRPSTTIAPKNINIYRQLFDNNKETIYYTKWVLNLRLFDDKKLKIPKIGEPHFYQEDLEKFVKKKKSNIKQSRSLIDIKNFSNLNKYKHFYKINNNNHGTYINKPLLHYNLSLRQNSVKILNKWNPNINIKNSKYYYSCVNLPKGELAGGINNKYIMRPYKLEFSKDEYNGNKIIKKSYTKDNIKAYNIFGDHLSSIPYNDKYIEKNYSKINGLLNSSDKSQTKTWYQIKLRNSIDNNDNGDKFKKIKIQKKWI